MIIAFLLVIAALLMVYSSMLLHYKNTAIRCIKAIGTKNSYLANSLVVQALFLSVVAMVISIVLVQGLEQILPAGMPFLLTTPMIAQYAAIFIVLVF